jgi:transposase
VARAAVERLFAWLKGGFRRLVLRYERLSSAFAALVYLACFLIGWTLLR